jgi:hypothetical protein
MLTLAGGGVLSSVSCGTLLYPERRGQRGGRLDATVILLDGLLLVLFLVPGVIAFAVDIYTGAIYLPPYEYGYGHIGPADFNRQTWKRIDVDPHELTPGRVEQVVFEQTGKRVRVEPAVFEQRRREAARGQELRIE